MYNILIFGTGNSSIIVENALNNNVRILTYLDNDMSKWNKIKNNIIINSPDKIEQYNYDYIIIASQFNTDIYKQLIHIYGIDANKIFQFYAFTDNNFNYYKYNMNKFISSNDEIELISTGISYAAKGFIEDICLKKSFKFAFSGQDLFYDYKTIKYIVENVSKRNNIKYALIGLCYYSFQYDMSMSTTRNKIILYYSVLKNSHNFKSIKTIYNEYKINKKIADNIFKKDRNNKYNFKWNLPTLEDYDDKWKMGKEVAEKDCNKNYPKTVAENKLIFIKYLELLTSCNIKPIVVVYSVTKYYSKYFSNRIEEEFHSIINRAKHKYDFQYIDYFKSNEFQDNDFEDVSHLNSKGAEKFTNILNKKIVW